MVNLTIRFAAEVGFMSQAVGTPIKKISAKVWLIEVVVPNDARGIVRGKIMPSALLHCAPLCVVQYARLPVPPKFQVTHSRPVLC